MAQTSKSADPALARPLKANISGIYFGQEAHYAPQEIISELRITNRQRTAEQQAPGELARIARLDKVRAGLQGESNVLARKREILAKPEAHRVADLTRVYMRRFLPVYGQSPEDQAKGELDLRLRGIELLEKLVAPRQDEETQLLRYHSQMMRMREPFFHPARDWEDTIDRV